MLLNHAFVTQVLKFLAALFIFVVGLAALALVVVYVLDVTQTRQALRRNRNTRPTGITTHDPRLQRGLIPAAKAERVAHYQRNMTREVGVLAHACGVREPRELNRTHLPSGGRGGPVRAAFHALSTDR